MKYKISKVFDLYTVLKLEDEQIGSYHKQGKHYNSIRSVKSRLEFEILTNDSVFEFDKNKLSGDEIKTLESYINEINDKKSKRSGI